ncbi:MAG: chemotaxis protein CheA [Verrucomicrobia bacterium]|nr:chemotaxis protein CheA [Verrucomicrobiota bacterium]
MNFDEIQSRSRELFKIEASDLLTELESALLELESAPDDTSIVHRVFRVMHTLKGSGATSGFADLSSFLHHVEDVFNAAREGRVTVTSELIDLTLKIGDAIKRYLATPTEKAAAVLTAEKPTLDALLRFMPGAQQVEKVAATSQRLSIRFQPHPHLFQTGNDPGVFLDDLRKLGPCAIEVLDNKLPSLETLEPETCYLGWTIEFTAPVDEAAVRDVFQFVDGDCDLEIKTLIDLPKTTEDFVEFSINFSVTEKLLENPAVLQALWTDLAALGQVVTIKQPPGGPALPGSWNIQLKTDAARNQIEDAFAFMPGCDLKIKRADTDVTEPAEKLATPDTSSPTEPSATGNSRASAIKAAATTSDTLRVSSDRLDRLVNLIGELVILKSVVTATCEKHPEIPPELHSAAETLQSLTTQLRDEVLNIRMMQIGQTFSKFRRLTRDLSRDLGKEVDLVLEGSETEMDKTILDRLNDPLVHLVRNSLDHGLETPAERIAAGKSPTGKLRLAAHQKGDRVIITVSDDGRGLDPARIRTKAIEQGLLAADAQISDSDLFQFVLLPGFSTAKNVSSLSGRGVGLDVVKRTIDQLRGRIELHSQLGKGAEFRLSLPLTLAIIDGLMVAVGKDRYILPLSAAREAIDLPTGHHTGSQRRNLVSLRGESIPYLRLRDIFNYGTPPPDLRERVVIVELEQSRLGLVVDEVLGNYQTVIKSLGWIAPEAPVYSGATVLGDGRIALIIDIPALTAYAAAQTSVTGMAKA